MKKVTTCLIIIACSLSAAFSQDKSSRFIEKEQLLESVGILSSSNLYLTYLSISLINNTLHDTTQADKLRGILNPIKKTMIMIAEHIEKLEKIENLSSEDVNVIRKISRACRLLLDDAELLDAYMNDFNDKNKQKFVNKHKETGEYLKELFKKEL